MKPSSPFFRDGQQRNLFRMLAAAGCFVGLLVLGRMFLNWEALSVRGALDDLFSMQNARRTYVFLLWNLFLAWIPYLAALRAEGLQRRGASWFALAFWLALWLAFFPNAPYILTDFVHLKNRLPVPVWYDISLLFSCAGTGLLLGLLSLYEVQIVLQRRFSRLFTWFLIVSAIGLGGFGVWLGRFQRWNSWDLLTNPLDLLRDLAQTLSQKHEFVGALGVSALLSGILLVSYGALRVLLGERREMG